MGYYKILSTPLPFAKEGYKGLHRAEPGYEPEMDERYLSFLERYIEHIVPFKNMGITTEFTVAELKEFTCLASRTSGEAYELIYFSEEKDCPHSSEYYGVDVTGLGG